MDSEACMSTVQSSGFLTFEVTMCAVVATIVVVAIYYVRRKWQAWYSQMVRIAFEDIDQDKSGKIQRDELWAGVLMLYIVLRRANIPADPPPREVVDQLMVKFDLDGDGEMSLDEEQSADRTKGRCHSHCFPFMRSCALLSQGPWLDLPIIASFQR